MPLNAGMVTVLQVFVCPNPSTASDLLRLKLAHCPLWSLVLLEPERTKPGKTVVLQLLTGFGSCSFHAAYFIVI